MAPGGDMSSETIPGAGPDPAAALLAALEGRWHLSREIDDRHAGTGSRFEGTAAFERAPGGLVYTETGELRLAGQPPLRAERSYLWQACDGRVVIRFGDGRPFHDFDPRAAAPAARHECPPDLYRVVYDFARWPGWRVVWEVRGPRKDYAMVSRYAPERRGGG